ncbi:MAG: right-handed parallel beta-helix repeat-containing protein [Phycisphaeraceae bacterium]|nr:right-handed parallel beta-helix repeat-containing protein [Phycisphaeraceae bacterium]
MRRHHLLPALAIGVGVSLITFALVAGPLDPPAGPVAGTNKTLAEVEPRIAINSTNTPGDADSLYKITAPGSYYLTGNITGVVAKHGIEIAASGVTLDLNGFDLVGIPGMGAFDGVSSLGIGFTNITVMNGSIRNWGGDGIDVSSIGQQVCRIEGILTSGNAGRGIFVSSGVVDHCSAIGNTGVGIAVGSASTVSNCTSRGSTNGGGYLAADGVSFTDCVAYQTTGFGFSSGNSCVFSRCVATLNLSDGFFLGQGCTIDGCDAVDNSGRGVHMIGGTVVASNIHSNSLVGIQVSGFTASTISSSSISTNGGDGITVGGQCTVTACDVFDNAGNGFSMGNSSTISGSNVTGNHQEGVFAKFGCLILNNLLDGNGELVGETANIRVSGTGGGTNRIEGNTCLRSNYGIRVDSAGNIIVRNTCSFNRTANWLISVNNYYGPIVNLVGVATPGQSGNGNGVDTLGTTHSNAKFSFSN